MSKLIYKPESLYKSNINDMVEELIKGGPGSGKRGHTTFPTETSKQSPEQQSAVDNFVNYMSDTQKKGELEANYTRRVELAAKKFGLPLEYAKYVYEYDPT